MSTDAKREGNARYHDKLERVVFRLHKDGADGITKEQIEAAASENGQSVKQWLIDTVKHAI